MSDKYGTATNEDGEVMTLEGGHWRKASISEECRIQSAVTEERVSRKTLIRAANELDALTAQLAEARKDAAIGKVVWRFIDRMNDSCEEDPAEKILAEFVMAVTPAIEAALPSFDLAEDKP